MFTTAITIALPVAAFAATELVALSVTCLVMYYSVMRRRVAEEELNRYMRASHERSRR